MSIDTDEFRAAMRHLAGHVCLITTLNTEGGRHGLTATAVCSVSADPPTLLCCINRQAGSYEAMKTYGRFAVNVLALEDRYLADRFASNVFGEDRFAKGDWSKLNTGAPILLSALASFDCQLVNAVDVHTHGILFGEIQAVAARKTNDKPLLYAHGTYGKFALLDAAPQQELLWFPKWEDDEEFY